MSTSSAFIHITVPVIGTDDILKSVSYYTKILGFTADFEYGDPPVYAGVKSGEAEIYFTHQPDLISMIKKNIFILKFSSGCQMQIIHLKSI